MDKINVLRNDIDQIDETIMELLEQRYDLSIKIGLLKKESNTTVLDTNREQFILKKAANYRHSPQITSVYNTILSESRNTQGK